VTALTTVDELAVRLASTTVLDVRWQLGRSDGRERHEAGHVPGAAYVDLETDLADPPGRGGRHPLPDPARFAEAMRRCGVGHDRPVVVYDEVGGTSAARCWWLLRFHGHPDVTLLDGGWAAWQDAGGAVETGPVTPPYGSFEGSPGHLPVVDAEDAERIAAAGALVDARAPERFRGEVEPVDPVAGHVPGAVNVPTAANLDASGRFRRVEELRDVYAAALEADAVAVYCGSGVTAAHDVLALELLGVRAALYAGSWSEWVTDPARAQRAATCSGATAE